MTSVNDIGGQTGELEPDPPTPTIGPSIVAAGRVGSPAAPPPHAPLSPLAGVDEAGVSPAAAAAPVDQRLRAARRRARPLVVLSDTAGLACTLLLAWAIVRLGVTRGTEEPTRHLGLWVVAYLPVYLLCLVAYGLYRRERRRLFATSFPDLVLLAHAQALGALLTLAVSHLLRRSLGVTPAISLTGVTLMSAPALIVVPLLRTVGGLVVRRRGMIRSRVVILGSGTVADAVARRVARFDDIELLGCVDDVGAYNDGGRGLSSLGLIGNIDELPSICRELDVDRVIVAFSPSAAPRLADTVRLLDRTVQVSVVPRLFDLVSWRSTIDELHGLPVMDVAPPVLSRGHRMAKRAIDLGISGIAVVVSLPVWVSIAIAVKLTSPGPVFFGQDRTGRGGRPFRMYKFRTMRVGADDEKIRMAEDNEVDGPLFKIKADPRVTPLGRFLRASSLDEFPQLFNVIKGDMSLVGPRPFVIPESLQIDGWAARRFDVRPGMTGLWQVSGRNDLPFEELRRLDYTYVASWSLWWDLKIMWQTPSCVLRRHGAY